MADSASVSLPSIHEMFPDHLMRKDDTQQRPRSHRGNTYPQSPGVHHRHRAPVAEGSHCGCSHADCPRQPHVSGEDIHNLPRSSAPRRSSASTASSSSHSHAQNIYAFNVLRSSPTAASLQHLTSSHPQFGSASGSGGGGEYYENHGQDGRSAYPSPPDAYTQQRTRGSVEGGDPNTSFPVSRSGGGPLSPPPSSPLSTQHRQQYRSPVSNSIHGEAEEDDDGNASGAEDNDTSNGKKHVCPTCYKRFNRPSSLRIHVNTHTGATPFRCPWPNCGREFNVNSNMRRHYRNHTTPGFSRSSSSSQQNPASTANPAPNLSAAAANNNNQGDGKRKRRRVSVPIPPAQIPPTEASANRGIPPDSGYPHPHPVYRSEYTYTYRHPHPHSPGSHYQQAIPPHSGYTPQSPSQFSSSQSHHQHGHTHNGHGHGHTQYAHSRSYPHPQTQRYLNAESVIPSPPISNLSMSEEDDSSSGSGDESDPGLGGIVRYRQDRNQDKMDGDDEEGDEGGELMQYDEHGYRTGSLAQSLARVAVHGQHRTHPHPYSRTQYHREREHQQERHSSMRGVGASGKGGQHPQRPLTPGSSFHSSSPSPSVSPSPPPSERHAVSSERHQGQEGEGQGRKTISAQSSYKYSASTPYVRSLADSRVSTTLRPAFSGAGEREREW